MEKNISKAEFNKLTAEVKANYEAKGDRYEVIVVEETNSEAVVTVKKEIPENGTITNMPISALKGVFRERFSNLLKSAPNETLPLGEPISFNDAKPWAIAYGGFSLAIGSFGDVRHHTTGETLGSWVEKNTPEGSEGAVFPSTLKIVSTAPSTVLLLSAYKLYEDKRGGFDGLVGDAIGDLAKEIRDGGLLDAAKETPNNPVPKMYFRTTAKANW